MHAVPVGIAIHLVSSGHNYEIKSIKDKKLGSIENLAINRFEGARILF